MGIKPDIAPDESRQSGRVLRSSYRGPSASNDKAGIDHISEESEVDAADGGRGAGRAEHDTESEDNSEAAEEDKATKEAEANEKSKKNVVGEGKVGADAVGDAAKQPSDGKRRRSIYLYQEIYSALMNTGKVPEDDAKKYSGMIDDIETNLYLLENDLKTKSIDGAEGGDFTSKSECLAAILAKKCLKSDLIILAKDHPSLDKSFHEFSARWHCIDDALTEFISYEHSVYDSFKDEIGVFQDKLQSFRELLDVTAWNLVTAKKKIISFVLNKCTNGIKVGKTLMHFVTFHADAEKADAAGDDKEVRKEAGDEADAAGDDKEEKGDPKKVEEEEGDEESVEEEAEEEEEEEEPGEEEEYEEAGEEEEDEEAGEEEEEEDEEDDEEDEKGDEDGESDKPKHYLNFFISNPVSNKTLLNIFKSSNPHKISDDGKATQQYFRALLANQLSRLSGIATGIPNNIQTTQQFNSILVNRSDSQLKDKKIDGLFRHLLSDENFKKQLSRIALVVITDESTKETGTDTFKQIQKFLASNDIHLKLVGTRGLIKYDEKFDHTFESFSETFDKSGDLAVLRYVSKVQRKRNTVKCSEIALVVLNETEVVTTFNNCFQVAFGKKTIKMGADTFKRLQEQFEKDKPPIETLIDDENKVDGGSDKEGLGAKAKSGEAATGRKKTAADTSRSEKEDEIVVEEDEDASSSALSLQDHISKVMKKMNVLSDQVQNEQEFDRKELGRFFVDVGKCLGRVCEELATKGKVAAKVDDADTLDESEEEKTEDDCESNIIEGLCKQAIETPCGFEYFDTQCPEYEEKAVTYRFVGEPAEGALTDTRNLLLYIKGRAHRNTETTWVSAEVNFRFEIKDAGSPSNSVKHFPPPAFDSSGKIEEKDEENFEPYYLHPSWLKDPHVLLFDWFTPDYGGEDI